MNKIYQIIFGIMAAISIAACADDKELAAELLPTEGGTMITVDATMPGGKAVSKVGLVQENGTFDVTTRWQNDDEIQLFAYQDGKSYSIGKVYVTNITSDHKGCSFSFELPNGINPKKTYNVFGLCGIEGTIANGEIAIDAPMKRVPLSSMKVPCYFATQATSTSITANFKYIGTYEILHIANNTGNTISFTHNGYTAESTWYNSGMRNTLQCSNASGAMSYSGKTATPTVQKVDIPRGETASIVSWYYPNGNTISNAVLNATIDGNNVKSSNTKSSNTVIQNGKAYHLYAIWNGKTLKFSDRNMEEEPDPQTQYEYVDLGLPSGTLWATCNVGAQNPWDYGDYFAWGEVQPKDYYDWDTYKYCEGTGYTMTKYCSESDYGHNDYTDNLTVLEAQDDAATANWGRDWRMPTQAEFQELYDNCDWEWTDDYNGTGVAGRIVKSRSNSNSIFLPASDINFAGSYGYYWSSSLLTDVPNRGRDIFFDSDDVYTDDWFHRRYGQSVRAVRREKAEPVKVEIEMIDLGLPSGTLWATCNVGAKNPWDYGDYFAWGETEPKDWYDDDTYTFSDNTTTLDALHDAATANLGSSWRMPTREEFQELLDNCKIEWTDNYQGTGVSGSIVWDTYAHMTHIFFPASGYSSSGDLDYAGSRGRYWSSSLFTDNPKCAWQCYFSSIVYSNYMGRIYGMSVRPVWCKPFDNPIETSSSVSNITIERKYLVHWNNNYCSPDFKIIFDNDKHGVRIGYDNEHYVGASGLILYAANDVDRIFDEELYGQWNMGSVLTDEWVNEKIVFTSDGNVAYYQNGSLLLSESVSVLGIKNAKSIRFDFNPYGWWTGHYHYMDDLKVTINGKLVIDDTFDYFDYNVWEEPVNPDGVKTEDGIMRMEQNRTDQDYHLRSKPISLVGY